ncbi:MAG: flippase-like domain-containing protein [Chloroflexi bacterium]|nr:flippase-like domain-containing protein [Chloroflexota bacterium]
MSLPSLLRFLRAHLRPSADGHPTTQPEPHAPVWRRVVTWLGLLIVCLVGYAIFRRAQTDIGQISSRLGEMNIPFTLGSLGLTLVCIVLGGISWYLVLRSTGQKPPLRECLRVQFLSNLGGYLPGYGWKYVGKGLLSRHFAPTSAVSAAVLVEFASLAVTRLVVALVVMPASFVRRFGFAFSWWQRGALWLFALALLLVLPWGLPRLAALWQRRNPVRWPLPTIHALRLLGALLLMCLTWLVYGAGFGLLVRSIDPTFSWDQVPLLLFGTTASFLVGLLVFFVPAGLTIREGVILFTLEDALPPTVALTAAILSRLLLLIAELLGAAIGAIMSQWGAIMSITRRD